VGEQLFPASLRLRVTQVGQAEGMVILLLCVAQFVVVLDVTIVAIALPAVQADLGLSTTTLGWVITGYTLTFGGCLLAAGRLADRVGRRRVFRLGLVLFALASLSCGLAPSGAALLAARGAQGLGAALVSPAALALLTTACGDGRARARALGWWTAAAAGGGASGWILGGLLSGLLDWRWVFFVNLPVCAVTVALAPRVLPERREASPARLDVAGAVLATTGLGALVLALTLAPSRGLTAGGTVASFGAAAALLAAFGLVESRAADPLVSRRLLRGTGVLEPNLVAAALTGTTTPPMFFCTLHAQQVLGLGPATAGLLFPPFNAAVIAGSLAGPRIATALGERRTMAGGLLGVAAGALALLAIAPGAPALPSLLGGFVLMGGGLGVASVASTARGTAALASGDQGLASGLLSTSAQIGTVLGLALIVPVAAARTAALDGGRAGQVAGYELGFMLAAALAAAAATAVGLRALLSASSRARLPKPDDDRGPAGDLDAAPCA
jgi:EmrB/QacA subfamily drug resistance transporter